MDTADAFCAQHLHRRGIAHVDLGQLGDFVEGAKPGRAAGRGVLRDHEHARASQQQLVAPAPQLQGVEQLQLAGIHCVQPAARYGEYSPAGGLDDVGLVHTRLLNVRAGVVLYRIAVLLRARCGQGRARAARRVTQRRDEGEVLGHRHRGAGARPAGGEAAPVADQAGAGTERLEPQLLGGARALCGLRAAALRRDGSRGAERQRSQGHDEDRALDDEASVAAVVSSRRRRTPPRRRSPPRRGRPQRRACCPFRP